MLTDKLFFKLNLPKGIQSFTDKQLNVQLTDPGKIAHWCYYHLTPINVHQGLLNETIIQISETDYKTIFPDKTWFNGTKNDNDDEDEFIPKKINLMFGVPIPSSTLGRDGDFYFRTYQKGQIYEKVSGNWVLRFDFSQSHKMGIPFTEVSLLDIPWSSERTSEFGLWPTIQAWLFNTEQNIYEITSVPMSFVNLQPDNIHIEFGGVYSGIIILS